MLEPPHPQSSNYYDYHHEDDSKASTSQYSYYDDDISDLENSVLGHISNAAFTNHHFYDNKEKKLKRYNRENHHQDIYNSQKFQENSQYPPSRDDYYENIHPKDHFHKNFYPHENDKRDKISHFHNKHRYRTEDYDKRPRPYIDELMFYPTYNGKPSEGYKGQDFRPDDDYHYDDDFHDFNDRKNNMRRPHDDYSDYDRYRSYGSRVEKKYHGDRNYHPEDRPELRYPLNSGYKYPDYYDDAKQDDNEPTMFDNLRKNLPWPLSIVGRIGEEGDSELDHTPSAGAYLKDDYPDSIQSILRVIDTNNDDKDKVHYGSHQVLPFLDVPK